MNPMLKVDFYKPHHQDQYPKNMTKLYSNGTCRKSRIPGIQEVVVFGIQHFVLEYLIKDFNENFFKIDERNRFDSACCSGENPTNARHPKDIKSAIIGEYKRHIPINTHRIEALWELGYLPIELKALDEGTLCPIGVPMLTITNTHPDFGWLVNYLETLISCSLWQAYTSATIAYEYRKILTKYAIETTGSSEFVQWQGHDFSMRGMSSVESATVSGMGHLLSFTGTDTIPAIYQLEQSYKATGLIGASVPATEHSVMCMGTKEDEIATFERLLDTYKDSDILSVVSDTWNLWEVVGPDGHLSKLKNKILAGKTKLVIRPDSGDPVDILCGTNAKDILSINQMNVWSEAQRKEARDRVYEKSTTPQSKGTIECLWYLFGGTINEQGFKVLDPHIGAIYGDAITMERATEICERLKAKGFASTNVVLGIGSYTYQYNTRDTFGFAMKATYGELTNTCEKNNNLETVACDNCDYPNCSIEPREIFKDPVTDDGTKKSKKGLLRVERPFLNEDQQKGLQVYDQQTWQQEQSGLLTTVFKDGKLTKATTLDQIRERLNSTL